LSQWTCCDLNTLGVTVFRVTGGKRTPGTKRFDVVKFKTKATQIQLIVKSQGRVTDAQNESVPSNPFRIGWIVAHNLLKKKVCNWRKADSGSRMSISDSLNRVGS
jgi:hypothetical protein